MNDGKTVNDYLMTASYPGIMQQGTVGRSKREIIAIMALVVWRSSLEKCRC